MLHCCIICDLLIINEDFKEIGQQQGSFAKLFVKRKKNLFYR